MRIKKVGAGGSILAGVVLLDQPYQVGTDVE